MAGESTGWLSGDGGCLRSIDARRVLAPARSGKPAPQVHIDHAGESLSQQRSGREPVVNRGTLMQVGAWGGAQEKRSPSIDRWVGARARSLSQDTIGSRGWTLLHRTHAA